MPDARFWRWSAGMHLSSLPAAMAPLAFTALGAALTGSQSIGATMVAAMILAQTLAAIPLGRLLDRRSGNALFIVLLLFRGGAFAFILLGAILDWSPAVLVAAAVVAGAVAGGVQPGFRVRLREIVGEKGLNRSVAFTATLTEAVFVIGPVLVGTLVAYSVFAPVAAMAVLTMVSAWLIPARVMEPVPFTSTVDLVLHLPLRQILPCCAASFVSGLIVVGIEVGAVSTAARLGQEFDMAIWLVVSLCTASFLAGVFWTWRSPKVQAGGLAPLLAVMVGGCVLVAFGTSAAVAIAGATVVGCCLAPIGIITSLQVERDAPKGRRAEGFSMLKTAHSLGTGGGALIVALMDVQKLAAIAAASAVLALWALLAAGKRPANADASRVDRKAS